MSVATTKKLLNVGECVLIRWQSPAVDQGDVIHPHTKGFASCLLVIAATNHMTSEEALTALRQGRVLRTPAFAYMMVVKR